MSIIQNSIKYNKPFIMIVICCQNLETRIPQIYHLWLKYCKYPFKIIIGRETQNCDYSIEGDIIYLKCKDNYDFLSYKIKLGMKVINHLYDYDCLFKCDDDIIIHNKKLYDFFNFNIEDYIGNVDKYQNFILENKIINLHFCNGPLYFLSKKALILFINDNNIYDLHEDVNMGYTLLKQGIEPSIVML